MQPDVVVEDATLLCWSCSTLLRTVPNALTQLKSSVRMVATVRSLETLSRAYRSAGAAVLVG